MNKTAQEIASMALRAILYELSASPKPGLVDRYNNGAHKDMNYFTFLDSSTILGFAFYDIVKRSLELDLPPQELFFKIRNMGVIAENNMFESTSGVNTQKGLLFSLGVICSATGYLIRTNSEINIKKISEIVKEMTEGIVKNELLLSVPGFIKSESKLTHGEKVFLMYQETGIRGEVEAGFPTVLNYGIPAFKYAVYKNVDINSQMLHVLISIMSTAKDTNVLYKHGQRGLEFVHKQAQAILMKGSVFTVSGRSEIYLLDKLFIKKKISPGGSADLLAITIMYNLLGKYFKQKFRTKEVIMLQKK